ncbi:MAG: DNA repair protein RecO [Acidobacteria bacterium]|nr:DNA repair protein RecO [Acidobacteriota bacterium]
MPLHDTEAFVLRTFSLKEADKVCVFFTRKAGKIRGVAHGARKLRSRYGASLEPFTEVSLTYFEKENQELVALSQCEILRSQFQEGLSSERLGVLHYLAELVDSFQPEHEPNETVYRLIAATIGALPEARIETLPVLVRYFEIWTLKLAGFFPEWRTCGLCERELVAHLPVWLTNEGIPQCIDCSGRMGEELSPAVWRVMRDILTQAPSRFLSVPREARLLQQIGGVATRLIHRVLERELRSYEVLDRLRPVEIA